MKAFGPVSARRVERVDLHPFRGVGVREDGSVVLAAVVRRMLGDKPAERGAYDSINLSAKEWAAFAPSEAKVGTRWTLPVEVSCRFCRCLSPISDLSTIPRPEEMTGAEIRAAVVSVEDGVATLAYRGSLAATHESPYHKGKFSAAATDVRGAATFDVKNGRMLSLTLIFDGTYRDFPPDDKEAVTVAGVEWRREPVGKK